MLLLCTIKAPVQPHCTHDNTTEDSPAIETDSPSNKHYTAVPTTIAGTNTNCTACRTKHVQAKTPSTG